jgi:hypothetical protein
MRWLAVLLLAIAAPLAVAGCGPSLRRVHRSEVYFERCYAADLDARVPIAERHGCWQGWLEHWQRDQSPERIDYVRERLLRLDPERAAVVAMALGGGELDPVPMTDATPAIAAEARAVSAAASTSPAEAAAQRSADGAEGAAAAALDPGAEPLGPGEAAPTRTAEPVRVEPPDSSMAEAVDSPEAPPRTVRPSHVRRAERTPVIPTSDAPHCAETCRPAWEACTERCATGDRAACLRACRLGLRACGRACY